MYWVVSVTLQRKIPCAADRDYGKQQILAVLIYITSRAILWQGGFEPYNFVIRSRRDVIPSAFSPPEHEDFKSFGMFQIGLRVWTVKNGTNQLDGRPHSALQSAIKARFLSKKIFSNKKCGPSAFPPLDHEDFKSFGIFQIGSRVWSVENGKNQRDIQTNKQTNRQTYTLGPLQPRRVEIRPWDRVRMIDRVFLIFYTPNIFDVRLTVQELQSKMCEIGKKANLYIGRLWLTKTREVINLKLISGFWSASIVVFQRVEIPLTGKSVQQNVSRETMPLLRALSIPSLIFYSNISTSGLI